MSHSTFADPNPLPSPTPRRSNQFEEAAREALGKIGNWIMVGEERRRPGVTVEFAMASTWLLRLGVLVLVTGLGFFLKYSIDHGWVAPELRVAMTIVAGAGMVVGGVKLMVGRYRPLGHALLGAGIAAFYFSIYAAWSFHHIIASPPAFGLMALVTAAACVTAVRFDSMLVAVLGICGGYGTPLLFAGASASHQGLYAYLLLMGCGVLAVNARRDWRLLNYLSLAAAHALFLSTLSGYEPDRFATTFPWLVAVFVLGSTSIIVFSVSRRRASTLLEWLALSANAAVFFLAGGMMIRASFGNMGAATLALGLAAYHLAHAGWLGARRIDDRGLTFGFLALAGTFVAIAIPLALSSRWITAAWSAQALSTLWLSGKTRSKFLRGMSLALYGLVMARFALVDLPLSYGVAVVADMPVSTYLALMVERIVVIAAPIGSIAGAARLLRRPDMAWDDGGGKAADSAEARRLLFVAAAMAFVFLNLEVGRTFGDLFPPARSPAVTLVWIGTCLALLPRAVRPGGLAETAALAVALTGALFRLLVLDQPGLVGPLIHAGPYSAFDSLMRLLEFAAVVGFLAHAAPRLRGLPIATKDAEIASRGAVGLAIVLAFVCLTLETSAALAHFAPTLRPGGVSILWTVFALGLVAVGINRREVLLRFAGLGLFAVVGFKVFLVDLAELDPLYRIVAFPVMGVLILFAAFLYLRSEAAFARPTDENAPEVHP